MGGIIQIECKFYPTNTFLEFKFDAFNLPILNLKKIKKCIYESQKKADLMIRENIF